MELLAAVLDAGGGSDGQWDEARWQTLRQAAMDGGLCPHPQVRGLAWRFFLGVLPCSSSDEGGEAEEFVERLAGQRAQYAQWKEQLYPDFNKVSKEGDDDPLSALTATGGGGGNDADTSIGASGGSSSTSRVGHHRHGSGGAWRRYYEGLELIEEIRRDLTRLYPSGVPEDHFIQPRTQEALLSVLFVWATLHKATAYRQGMHELLAVLLYALQHEKQQQQTASPLMAAVADPAFLEADAFLLFDKLMLHLEPLYYVERPPAHYPTSSRPPTTGEEAPVIRLSKRIQGEMLRRADPEVHESLQELEVTPQLYGIKWTRLLFAREFSMPDVLRLWDFMLAAHTEAAQDQQEQEEEEEEEEPLQAVIAAVAVAMIIAVRPALLTDDVSVALRRLMTYAPQPQQPPSQQPSIDIGGITALAHAIHRRDWPAVHAARARFGGGSGSRAPTPVALNPFTRTAMPASVSPSPPLLQQQPPQQQPPQQQGQQAAATTVPSWLKGFGGGTNSMGPWAPSPSYQQQQGGSNGNGAAGPLRLLGSSLGAVVDKASSTMHNIADLAFYRRDGSHLPHHHASQGGSLGGSSVSGSGVGTSLWGQQQLQQLEEERRRRALEGELEAGVKALEEHLAAALPPSDDEGGAHAPVWDALRRVQAATTALLGGTAGGAVVPPTPTNTLRVGALEEEEAAVVDAGATGVMQEQEPQPPAPAPEKKEKEERRKTAHAALSSLLDGDLSGSGAAGRGGGGGLWGDSSSSSKTGTLDPKLSELLS